MKLTVRQLKQLIKEQVEEVYSPNYSSLSPEDKEKHAREVRRATGSGHLDELEDLKARVKYLEKQVKRLNGEATS